MSNRILKSVLMLAVCLPTLALAQRRPAPPAATEGFREGSWEFSLGAGFSILDGAFRGYLASGAPEYRFANSLPSRLAPTATARVGYNFTRHLGFSFAGTLAGGSGVRYLTESAALTYTWNLDARTSPFVLGGMELTRVDGINSRTTHSTKGGMLGIGVRHMISENLALRLEGQTRLEGYQELATGNAWTSVATIGLSYFVGAKRPVVVAAGAPVCRPCTLARVDTVRQFRRDTLRVFRTDTVRTTRVDTVEVFEDQLVLRVQFMTDSTVLLRRTLPALDTIAKALAYTPEAYWEVQGHTDNVGDAAHNRRLAEGRAQAVIEYLVRHGVARDHLRAVGYGDTRPVVSNATVEGRAQNRRVQIRRRTMAPPPGRPVP